MQTLLQSVREILGTADFYIENGNYSGSWDYGAMCEYFVCALLLLIVVTSVFKLLLNWSK